MLGFQEKSKWATLCVMAVLVGKVFAQSVDPQVYVLREDGSVWRVALSGGDLEQVFNPRAGFGGALSYDSYYGSGILLSGNTGVLRHRFYLDSAQTQILTSGNADTVAAVEGASNYYALFGATNDRVHVYRSSAWPVSWVYLAYVVGVEFLDGIILPNGDPVALLYQPFGSKYLVIRWNALGEPDTLYNGTNPLRGLAARNADTLITYSRTHNRFAKLSVVNKNLVTMNINADTVRDIRVLESGRIVWSDHRGIWSAVEGETPILRHTMAGIRSIALDEFNGKPLWEIKKFVSGMRVPLNGFLSLQLPSWSANDGDEVGCRVVMPPKNSLIYSTGRCQMFLEVQSGAVSGARDSARVELRDPRGSRDTVEVVWQYAATNAPPSFYLPSAVTVEFPHDLIIQRPVAWEPGEMRSYYVFREQGSFGTTTVTDTLCETLSTTWLAQSFMSPGFGNAYFLQAALYSDRPIQVIVQYGSSYDPNGTPLWSGMFTASQLRLGAYMINNQPLPSLAGAVSYVVAFIPQSGANTSYCRTTTDVHSGGQFSTANSILPESDLVFGFSLGELAYGGMLTPQLWEDSLRLAILPRSSDLGTVTSFRALTWDGVQSFSQSIQVSVPASMSMIAEAPFVSGPDLRLTAPEASGYYQIPRWLTTEATGYPRFYEFVPLNGADSVFEIGTSVDAEGTLNFMVSQPARGAYDLRVRRCRSDTTIPCSNWDTVRIVFSTPPTVSAPASQIAEAWKSAVWSIVARDPDAGDLALSQMRFGTVIPLYDQPFFTDSIEGKAVIQTFTAPQSGTLYAMSVYAYSYGQSLTVTLVEVPSVNGLALTGLPVLMKIEKNVLANQWRWHRVEFPAISLQSGKNYAIVFGKLDSANWNIKVGCVSAATGIAGQSFVKNYLNLVGEPNKDLAIKMDFVAPLPNWITLNRESDSVWSVTASPSIGDSGFWPLYWAVDDGTGLGVARTDLTISPASAIPLLFTAGPDLLWGASPEKRIRRVWEKWVDVNAMPPGRWFETMYAEPQDSLYFELPQINADGTLELYQKGEGRSGAGAFLVRLCASGPYLCSPWDTVIVRVNSVPKLVLSGLKDSAVINKTLPFAAQVTDGDDVASAMLLGVYRANDSALARSMGISRVVSSAAWGQTFIARSRSPLGMLRVYARFPRPYVRVVIASMDSLVSVDQSALFDQYLPVTSNLLQWHDLPIPMHDSLFPGQKYHISLGYEDSVQFEVGVDTVNAFADGVLIRYTNNSVTHGLGYVFENAWDLSFELYAQSSVYFRANGGIGGLWNMGVVPAKIGPARYVTWVADGVNRVASLFTLVGIDTGAVAHPDSVNPLRLIVLTRGQAMQVRLNSPGAWPAGYSMRLHLSGENRDSLVTMNAERWTWLGVPVGEWIVSWSLESATGVSVGQGDTVVQIRLPETLPVKLQTWSMVGFGTDSMPLSALRQDAQIFSWDDAALSGDFGGYRSRGELLHARPGIGFWYFAETLLDSIAFKPVESVPASLRIPVVRRASGWNMIANPYSWPIALHGAKFTQSPLTIPEFWGWDANSAAYRPITVLEPYTACWVKAPLSGELVIPVSLALDSASVLPKQARVSFASVNDWSVQIVARSGKFEDRYNFIGVSPEASDGIDNLDGYKPPLGPASPISLAILSGRERLSRDLRRVAREGQIWELELVSADARRVELTWPGVAALRNAGWTLVLIRDQRLEEIGPDARVVWDVQAGTNRASIRLARAQDPLWTQNAPSGLRVSGSAHGLEVEFVVSPILSGSSGAVEWVTLSGQLIARAELSDARSGIQRVSLRGDRAAGGVSLIRVRLGDQVIWRRIAR